MKKATMTTILSMIATIDTPEAEAVRAELKAELNRGAEKADANRKLYEAVEDKLPEGFTKAKVQYALSHYWEADVVKHEGKVNSYTRA